MLSTAVEEQPYRSPFPCLLALSAPFQFGTAGAREVYPSGKSYSPNIRPRRPFSKTQASVDPCSSVGFSAKGKKMYTSPEHHGESRSVGDFQLAARWPLAPQAGQEGWRALSHGYRLQQEAPADPLYLLACSLRWHREKDAAAGWELFHFLGSTDHNARALAADLLAKTKHTRLLVRQLRRAKAKLNHTTTNHTPANERSETKKVAEMNTPYGLEIIESCLTCKLRRDNWFCGLSHEGLKSLAEASHLTTFPGGALLFVEGQIPRGAYVLCSGKAKLSTTSRDGKVLILKIAEAGEVLGLSAVISGQPFQVTAETAGPCQVNFIEREALLQRIEKSGELGLHSSQALSREFQSAYQDIHDLILARSSAGKLAKLLLSGATSREKPDCNELRIRPTLTHEEMAQMIGSSRETVTRLLGDLKKKELIRLEGSTLVIQNRMALEALAA
jgi:CRP/FNR family transcriptional regulator, cyclic AMP receptor protein